MEPTTHQEINSILCGEPLDLGSGYSVVRLKTSPEMRADAANLVHGGFIFSMADYAAMLAVGHPNVVLGSADVRFLRPVRVGENLIAEAIVQPSEVAPDVKTKKPMVVVVTVKQDEETVFTGQFICFVLDQHVLA
jgi:acyl-coenzyme A thioesterase PaaI-like protein